DRADGLVDVNAVATAKAEPRRRLARSVARRDEARVHRDLTPLKGVEHHVERHHFGERRWVAHLFGVVVKQDLASASVHHDRGVTLIRPGRWRGETERGQRGCDGEGPKKGDTSR